jgi:uncharacterized protein
MAEDRNGKTYSFDVCSQCNLLCCREANPPLTEARVKIISAYLQGRGIKTDELFVREGYTHPATDAEGICALFNKQTGKCSVHPVKPETCRAGPVTFDINLQTGKAEWFLKKGQICALAEVLFKDKTRFQQHFEAAKPELMQLICQLDEASLRAILRIPEPETFKVCEDALPKEVLKKLGIAH